MNPRRMSIPPRLSAPPPRPPARELVLHGVGVLLALGIVAGLADLTGEHLLSAGLGATAIIMFALPRFPLAQPRAAIGGQLVATLVALGVSGVLGSGWIAIAVAGSLALTAMQLTRTLHAPAGATALIVVLDDVEFDYVLAPVLVGSILVVAVAWLILNVEEDEPWPEYWW